MDVAATAARAADALREAGDAARAEHERRYLKSTLEHYGASVPSIRRMAKALLKTGPAPTRDELVALVEALWARPVH